MSTETTEPQSLSLADLRLDEETLSELILSTGVPVPKLMMSVAKVICADIVLGSILAEDLPPGADFESSLKVLKSHEDPRMRMVMTEFRDALIERIAPLREVLKDEEIKNRWDFLIFYFSEEGVMHQLASEMSDLNAV